MLGISIQLRDTCDGCLAAMPVNGIVPSVVCALCQTPHERKADLWKFYLEDAVKGAPQLAPGATETQTFNGTRIIFGNDQPRCAACSAEVPLDELDRHLVQGACFCAGCGQRISVRRVPPELLALLVTGDVVAIGEDPAIIDPKNPVKPPPLAKPVLFPCPQCGGALAIDGAGRMVECTYCSSTVFLPDELWRTLHPFYAPARWYLWLDPAQIVGKRRR